MYVTRGMGVGHSKCLQMRKRGITLYWYVRTQTISFHIFLMFFHVFILHRYCFILFLLLFLYVSSYFLISSKSLKAVYLNFH